MLPPRANDPARWFGELLTRDGLVDRGSSSAQDSGREMDRRAKAPAPIIFVLVIAFGVLGLYRAMGPCRPPPMGGLGHKSPSPDTMGCAILTLHGDLKLRYFCARRAGRSGAGRTHGENLYERRGHVSHARARERADTRGRVRFGFR